MRRRSNPAVRTAALQEKTEGKVRCLVCERRCLLVEGGQGWCRTRVNLDGTLHTLTYGAVSSLAANPIPPETFVLETVRQGCRGTSISFNEPTLSFEWSRDVFRLARAGGLYNTFVTNGYMTATALEQLAEAGLDAMNVDIKGDAAAVRRYGRGVDAERIWARCRQARELGLHLEITLLVIPGVNDDNDSLAGTARRIADELGPQTPWHVSGYFPAYRFTVPPTPVATLERAWRLGRREGLEYVYVGNTPLHPYDNTYCPGCDSLLVERHGLHLARNAVIGGRCPRCDRKIAGVGWNWARP